GNSVSLSVYANQPDGDPLSYDATGLPNGLSIDPDTGIISGTIDPDEGGKYSVTVTATDYTLEKPVGVSQTFTWDVTALPLPVFSATADQTNLEGDAVTLAVTATDPSGGIVSYSASSLPDGLSIDPSTGIISGTISAG